MKTFKERTYPELIAAFSKFDDSQCELLLKGFEAMHDPSNELETAKRVLADLISGAIERKAVA